MLEIVIVLLALAVVVLHFRKAARPLWRRGDRQEPCAGCPGCSGADSTPENCPSAGRRLHEIDNPSNSNESGES